MQLSPYFSFPQQWNAQDLTNAVPLCLHQLLDFDALRDARGIAAANSDERARRASRPVYVKPSPFHPHFTIR